MANQNTGREHRKGDQHSGGGGANAGGGKKGRPQGGWEKGDLARDSKIANNRDELKAKPGPRSKKLLEERER